LVDIIFRESLLFGLTREMTTFTDKQGQYLAFIYNYSVMFGQAPAESDLQRFFGTSPPTVHQMIVKLAAARLIARTPGQARSIRLLVDPDEIPRLVHPSTGKS
jgi:repressor LexA